MMLGNVTVLLLGNRADQCRIRHYNMYLFIIVLFIISKCIVI